MKNIITITLFVFLISACTRHHTGKDISFTDSDTVMVQDETGQWHTEHVITASSPDSVLVIRYWNTHLGGTCPDIASEIYVRGTDGALHKANYGNADKLFFTSIEDIMCVDGLYEGNPIYLVSTITQASTATFEHHLHAIVLENDSVKDAYGFRL